MTSRIYLPVRLPSPNAAQKALPRTATNAAAAESSPLTQPA